jgi:hypothetical protein
MKCSVLTLLVTLLGTAHLSSAQCVLQSQKVYLNNAGESLTVELEYAGAGYYFVDSFKPVNPSEPFSIEVPGPEFSYTIFVFDEEMNLCATHNNAELNMSMFVLEGDLEGQPLSMCNATDGRVCKTPSSDLTGFNFAVAGTPSVDGCVGNLAAGDHTVVFDPVIDANGIEYYSEPQVISVPTFDVSFDHLDLLCAEPTRTDRGILEMTVNGGSGSYALDWSIPCGNIDPGNNRVIQDIKCTGCFSVTITDLVDNTCTATFKHTFTAGSCPGDYYCDGVINTNELLYFLGEFGHAEDQAYAALDCDGVINVSDMLALLSAFSSSCE